LIEPIIVTDAKGRKLTIRRLNVLDQVRLLRAIGAAQSSNEPYVNVVTMAASVSEIDGVPVPPVTNERQIDAAVGRIGDPGFAAIMVNMNKEVAEVMAAAEAASNDAEVVPADPLAPSA
jgi:hypothetical protein